MMNLMMFCCIRLRLLVEVKGYSFDDYGLYLIVIDVNGGKVNMYFSNIVYDIVLIFVNIYYCFIFGV